MVFTCCVYGCLENKNKNPNVSLFRIPGVALNCGAEGQYLLKRRRKEWAKALKREYLNDSKLNNLRVCGRHFITGKPAHFRDILNKDWVPNKELCLKAPRSSALKSRLSPSPRSPINTKKKLFQSDSLEFDAAFVENEDEINFPYFEDSSCVTETGTHISQTDFPTDLTMTEIDLLQLEAS